MCLNFTAAYSQNFRLPISRYQNSCTKENEYPSGESIMSWSLSANRAILYYGTNNMPVENFSVIKYEFDNINNSHNYTYFDDKRSQYGMIIYFRNSNVVSMQYVNTKCSIDYAIGNSYSNYGNSSSSEAAAYVAVGIVGIATAVFSNDFYIQFIKSNSSKFNNRNRFIEDHGYAFGFRKTFDKSAIELGTSLIPQTDYTGEEGGSIKWGAHCNYIYNIPLIKNKEKANLLLGASANSFFTKSEPFGVGGLLGISFKIFNWLRFESRYELTTYTDRINTGLFLTYNKN